MSITNRLWRAPVTGVTVKSPQEADDFRNKIVQRRLENDGEAKSFAIDALRNGKTDQYKKTVDRVIGDGDSYISVLHVDIAVGPGFCHCDCKCET